MARRPSLTLAKMLELAEAADLPKGSGEKIASFVVPLHVSPLLNRFREMPGWELKRIKSECHNYIMIQTGYRKTPLTGRPDVIAVRFSSRQPDWDSAFTKIPLDRLTPRNGGVGIIADDSPESIRLVTDWRKSKSRQGFTYFSIWTGAKQ